VGLCIGALNTPRMAELNIEFSIKSLLFISEK